MPMPAAVFLLPDGRQHAVAVSPGTSLMKAATQAGVEGIVGDCGGLLSCSTCHVIVLPEHAARLDPPQHHEAEMLEFTAAPREETSRLCCQIVMQEQHDGLTVRVAHPQL